MKQLELDCVDVKGDTLTCEVADWVQGEMVVLTTYDHMQERRSALALNKETARQLANWLFAYLHT